MSKRLQYLCLSSSAFIWHALLGCKATLQVFFASGHPTNLGSAAPSAQGALPCYASCAGLEHRIQPASLKCFILLDNVQICAGHRFQSQWNRSVTPPLRGRGTLPALLSGAEHGVIAAFRGARHGVTMVLNDTGAALYNAYEGLPASRQETQGWINSSNSFQAARLQNELAAQNNKNSALTARNADLEESLDTVMVKVSALAPVSATWCVESLIF